MKKLLAILVIFLFPVIAYASFTIPWVATSTATPWVFLSNVNNVPQNAFANTFTATSTTATSTFPNVSFDRANTSFAQGTDKGTLYATGNNGLLGQGFYPFIHQFDSNGGATYPSNLGIGLCSVSNNCSFAGFTGHSNLGLGLFTLSGLSSGNDNTGVGFDIMGNLTNGSGNVAVGSDALGLLSTGSQNTAIGGGSSFSSQGACANTLGSGNVCIGYRAGETWGGSNKLFIANSNTVTPLINGDFAAASTTIYGSLNVATTTATSTFANGINMTKGCYAVSGTCVVGVSGGTAGMIASWVNSSTLTATSGPTASYYTATSSNATSTFAGGFAVQTSKFVVNRSNGYVGIGITTPINPVQVGSIFTTNSTNGLSATHTYDNNGECYTADGDTVVGHLYPYRINPTSGNTIPAMAATFTFSDDSSGNQYFNSWTWNPALGVDGYWLEVEDNSTHGNFDNWIQLGLVTSYTDDGCRNDGQPSFDSPTYPNFVIDSSGHIGMGYVPVAGNQLEIRNSNSSAIDIISAVNTGGNNSNGDLRILDPTDGHIALKIGECGAQVGACFIEYGNQTLANSILSEWDVSNNGASLGDKRMVVIQGLTGSSNNIGQMIIALENGAGSTPISFEGQGLTNHYAFSHTGLTYGADMASEITDYDNQSIGSSYTSTAAPTNGLIVQGNTGIATSSPWGVLSVGQTTANPAFAVGVQGSSTPAFLIGGTNQNGNIQIGGSVTTYNSTTTAGVGLTPIVLSQHITGKTAAFNFTPYQPKATTTLQVNGYVVITAVTLDVIQPQCTFTDETGTSRTMAFSLQSVAAGIAANAGTTGYFSIVPGDMRVKANTQVACTIALTTGTGSITYDAGGLLLALDPVQ